MAVGRSWSERTVAPDPAHFCTNRLRAITASARCGTCSASPLSSRHKIKGHNCCPVDHRDGVIPKIADAHLALRLHLLQIFPSCDRCFFQVPIRAALAIYLDLETSTEVLLKHTLYLLPEEIPFTSLSPIASPTSHQVSLPSDTSPLRFASAHARSQLFSFSRVRGS